MQNRDPNSSSNSANGGDGGRLYNPYADLYGAAINPRSVDTIYRLPTSPEYLFQEEAAFQRRSWSENLTYYTGCGYLSGAILGGGTGLVKGLRAAEEGDTPKLRINRVLNASGHDGRTIGNKLGILGLLYAGMESGIVHLRGTDDILNSIAAGLGTGVLYKVAAGPRAAALAGAFGGLAAGALTGGKHVIKRYLPI